MEKKITLRLSQSEYNRLTVSAGEASINSYIRRLIEGGERMKKEAAEISTTLKAIAGKLDGLKQTGEQNGTERIERGIRELKTIITVIGLNNPITNKRLRELFPKLCGEVDAL